jgi:triosephosphate isomerase
MTSSHNTAQHNATKVLVVGNWKMNLGVAEAREFISRMHGVMTSLARTELWVTPPDLSIAPVVELLKGTTVAVGAQNVHHARSGAFTGDLSVAMLREVGCSYALVGHSERRHGLGESVELSAARALGALEQSFPVVFCIGETLAERESQRTMEVLHAQLSPLCAKLTTQSAPSVIIAYEPVWAIGTGKVASLAEIEETVAGLVAVWKKLAPTHPCPRILYGGSVDNNNIAGILNVSHVAGCLVGGASIHPEKFPALLEASERR